MNNVLISFKIQSVSMPCTLYCKISKCFIAKSELPVRPSIALSWYLAIEFPSIAASSTYNTYLSSRHFLLQDIGINTTNSLRLSYWLSYVGIPYLVFHTFLPSSKSHCICIPPFSVRPLNTQQHCWILNYFILRSSISLQSLVIILFKF